jgi:Bacterial Ig-like domain (group 2)/Glucodextranase, domain B
VRFYRSSVFGTSGVIAPYVAISGTISDGLSGVAGVTCNDATASVSGTSFSCTVPLNSVSNSIAVVGVDVAGNTTTSNLDVTVSMAAPTSLTVTPPNPTLTIGGTQAFTAVDENGTPRPDATWTISDTTIASFETDSPNTLVGNAAGTATVTATVGTVTGKWGAQTRRHSGRYGPRR